MSYGGGELWGRRPLREAPSHARYVNCRDVGSPRGHDATSRARDAFLGGVPTNLQTDMTELAIGHFTITYFTLLCTSVSGPHSPSRSCREDCQAIAKHTCHQEPNQDVVERLDRAASPRPQYPTFPHQYYQIEGVAPPTRLQATWPTTGLSRSRMHLHRTAMPIRRMKRQLHYWVVRPRPATAAALENDFAGT